MEIGVMITTEEYKDLCEKAAVAEERLTALYDYIEAKDIEEAESSGHRKFYLEALAIKSIIGYKEKLAAYKQISAATEAYEAEKEKEKKKAEEKEDEQNGNTI